MIKSILVPGATSTMADAPSVSEETLPPWELESEPPDDTHVGLGDSAASLPKPGEWLGPYIVEGTLGAGGMGIVYAARDPQRDRRVAVKLLHRWRKGSNAQQEYWLRNEATALARLSHPNVVQVLGVGTYDDRTFLAMELVEGPNLSDWLKQTRRRSWQDVTSILHEAARGLAAVHEAGLIHGDFKPDNVKLGHDGRVRVMDFGLARSVMALDYPSRIVVGREGVSPHRPVGTPAYMAPEQLSGERVDARADQFSLCVTLYEALYGERPFRGDTPAELAYNVMHGHRRTRLDDLGLPRWLDKLIMRGLSVTPVARWPNMAKLAEALAYGLRISR